MAVESELAEVEAALGAGAADQALRRLQALGPALAGDRRLHYLSAAALGALGEWDAHRASLRAAEQLHGLQIIAASGGDLARLQADPAYAAQVGEALYGQNMVAIASVALGFALARGGADPALVLRYGLSLQHQGRMPEATAAFRAVSAMVPHNPQARGFLLYSLFHAPDGVRAHAEAAAGFARIFDGAPRMPRSHFANPPLAGRRLRIGYVAPDALGTQLRQFFAPVLEHHDPAAVELVHYMAAPPKAPPPQGEVRVIGGISDDDAAELIRADGIDVLLDLWGHTANGRLGVFARRAAPVQISWLNYVQTTGVKEMDHLLHPDCLKVAGAQEACAEEIVYMGPDMAPFRPDPRPDPAPTPALATGRITFGSYTHPMRLSDETIDGWARILKRSPGARLVLRYSYYVDEVLRAVIHARFLARGVTADRIEFRGRADQPEYYRSYAEIDLALDPAPCPAGTTSLDALANGVPVLTLAGRDYYSRIGVCNTGPMGLDELIVESWDEYVKRAVALTSDVQALDALRRRVRASFDASGRRDEAGFTHRFEGLLTQLFNRWREGLSHHAAA